MSNTPPKVFRSGLNGAEVEKLLRSISDKVNQSNIIQDLSSTSASDILSASVVNAQIKLLKDRTSGVGVKAMLDAAPDVNTLTDALLAKINATALIFIGVVTLSERAAIDTDTLKGGEVILLRQGTEGVMQYWSKTDGWVGAATIHGFKNAISASSGTTTLQNIKKGSYKTASFTVSAHTNAKIHVCHYTIGWLGDTIYVSSHGELRAPNDLDLFTLKTSMSGDNIVLEVVTTETTTEVQIEVQSVY
ncbi:hypothetical protein VPHK469_0032 [Vibrio phage K469]